MESITLTREELYNLVWTESMLALSKKYNISDGIATQSYLLMGDSLVTDEAGESQKLKSQGLMGSSL